MSRTPPPVHADSKQHLAELCLRSFKEGLGRLRAKVYAILDNCPPAYEEMFASLWPREDLVLIRTPGLGNAGTFGKQLEILSTQVDSDIVYFAEDDYVYLPDRLHLAVDLIRSHPEVGFCSPYDHPDFYSHAFHLHKMQIKVQQGQVWKTQNGTTCTFFTRKDTLRKARKTLACYTRIKRWNVDACMWLSLTKHHVLNPVDLLTQPFIFPYRGASLVFAWLHNWPQIIFGPRYTLWIPAPSLATHMVAKLLAPFHDWHSEFARLESQKKAAGTP